MHLGQDARSTQKPKAIAPPCQKGEGVFLHALSSNNKLDAQARKQPTATDPTRQNAASKQLTAKGSLTSCTLLEVRTARPKLRRGGQHEGPMPSESCIAGLRFAGCGYEYNLTNASPSHSFDHGPLLAPRPLRGKYRRTICYPCYSSQDWPKPCNDSPR